MLLPCCALQAVRQDAEQRAALEARLVQYREQDAPARAAREALLAANKAAAAAAPTAVERARELQQEGQLRRQHMMQASLLKSYHCSACSPEPMAWLLGKVWGSQSSS